MAMTVRTSATSKEFQIAQFENNFAVTRLEDLSLEDLARRYADINDQAHMMKGLILLEARKRFPSNNEFGAWVKSVFSICEDGAQARNRLMKYAKFFQSRNQAGISLSACYAISAMDDELAEVVYQEVQGKNLPLSEVKKIIGKSKGKTTTPTKEQILQKVANLVHQLDDTDAIEVLKQCLSSYQVSSGSSL